MMGLLRKVCRRVWKGLSRRNHACKDAVSDTRYGGDSLHESMHGATTSTVSVTCTSLQGLEQLSIKPSAHGDNTGSWSSEFYAPPEPATVVNVTRGCESENLEMLSSVAAAVTTTGGNELAGVRNLSSESDSGVCLGGESDELINDDSSSEWSEEEEYECECEECAFSRCEDILEDWHISAKDIALDKVLSSHQEEMVYSGYWHGSVTVHQRQSKRQTVLNFYIREAHMLSKIRHENVQLFLGVCLDLHQDSVALVMSDIKGESLHSLVHRKRQEFPFAALTKYINQIAQGMAYLHDRGIAHPLLASSCISIHYRVCISMLSPAFCSNSVEPSQLVYLPPEVIRTLHHSTTQHHSHHRQHTLLTDPTNQDSTDANIFSFGTIVYEMVTMSRPFPTTPGELIIWEVGNNRHQSLQHMNNGKFKDIIQRCWSPEPDLRPSFKELLCTLEQNMSPRACGLNAYFSFSDPGRLAKTGLR